MTALLIIFPLVIIATLASVAFSAASDFHEVDSDYTCCDAIDYKDYSIESNLEASTSAAQNELVAAA
jgi:hypothetical protein